MRKAIFTFIAIIIVAVGFDWTDACSEEGPMRKYLSGT